MSQDCQVGVQVDLGKIGIGAWAWGDTLFWGYDQKLDNELRDAFELVATSGGAGFIGMPHVACCMSRGARRRHGRGVRARSFRAANWRICKASTYFQDANSDQVCGAALENIGRRGGMQPCFAAKSLPNRYPIGEGVRGIPEAA